MDKQHLRSLIREMAVPTHRQALTESNVRWMQRNLAIQNSDHPQFETVQKMLVKIAQSQDWDME
jgi:hypothetical protein